MRRLEKVANFGYEFRQYDSRLGRWWGVDPKWSEYPNVSPYVFCNGSPIMLMDPNGEKIFVANEKSKKYISDYMKDQFGNDNFYTYTKNNKLKICIKNYRDIYKSANNYQKTLLKGIRKAIRNPLNVTIDIDDREEFDFKLSTPIYDENFEFLGFQDKWGKMKVENGVTLRHGSGDCLIFINNKGAESSTMSSESGETGKSASAVFFHELLDEYLNYQAKGKTTDSSTNIEKVFYQNNALQNKGLSPRNGNDHQ